MGSRNLLLIMIGLMLLPGHLYPGAEELSVQIWCELEPMIYDEAEYPRSPETAARLLLDEGRIYLSAMLYGYRFIYTPLDRARQVKEIFALEPIAEIGWGDPNLKIVYTKIRDGRVYGKLAYTLQGYQSERRHSWESNTVESVSGRGEESLLTGETAKIGAFQEAVKQAIREYARQRIYSKPREISGEVLLWSSPRTILDAGAYWTTVKIKIFLKNHRPYTIY